MIISLTGENELERSAELRQIVADFEAMHGEMAVERIDGEEATYDRICEAAQSVPFLTDAKLVIVRAPSTCKEFTDQFEAFVKGVAETNTIVLVEPKLDRRLGYYKLLKKLTDFKDFPILDANGLANWASAYVKAEQGSITTADARLLVERVGTNQTAIRQELDKLLAYSAAITRQSIELLTEKTPQSSVFELLDAAFAGDAKRAMRLYDEQRALKVEPQQIMAMLAWQLHVLALVLTAKGRSTDEIAREAKLNPYVVRKTQALARRITLMQLKQLVSSLREYDIRTKTEGILADEAVRYFMLQMI
ncbi:DNA polymerase III subunit delta [Candidatus Saccharibacteria bacterium]|nr:DNA polymerase III subunit delta [Candidatus Saccharibacteria bacterium]